MALMTDENLFTSEALKFKVWLKFYYFIVQLIVLFIHPNHFTVKIYIAGPCQLLLVHINQLVSVSWYYSVNMSSWLMTEFDWVGCKNIWLLVMMQEPHWTTYKRMSSWTKYFPVWSSHSVRKHILFSALVCLKKCYLIQGRFSVNHKIILRLVMWTLYTLTSVCIFSTQFFIHLLRCLQGEFVNQSNGFFPADHFLNSHDLKCVIQEWYCREKLDARHS